MAPLPAIQIKKRSLKKNLFYKYLLRSYPHKSEYDSKYIYIIPFANRTHFTIGEAI